MLIRNYEPDDLNALYEIAINSLDEFYDPNVFNYFTSQWQTGQFVAVNYDGKPIGFLFSTKLQDRQARILLFAVENGFRNRGIGKQLLDSFRLRAMMEGITGITLEVRDTNIAARKFYTKNGFIETMILRSYYKDGGDGIRMDAPVQNNV